MKYSPNPTRVQAALDRANGVFASILDAKLVSAEVAKVIVSLSDTKVSQDKVCASVASALDGQFAPVLGSFRPVDNGRQPTFIGFVAANREMISANEDRFQRLRPLTAGIMLDPEDDSVWNLHEGEHGTFVLREGEEDVGKVLETARVRQTNAPVLASLNSTAQVGDFISFVDGASGSLRHGFVLASNGDNTIDVVTGEDEEPLTVAGEQVVEAVEFEDEDKQELEKASRVVKAAFEDTIPSQTEYYKQLFAYAPEYLKQIQEIIDGNASF